MSKETHDFEILEDASPADFPVGGNPGGGGGRKPRFPVSDLQPGQNLMVRLTKSPEDEGHDKEKERIRGSLNTAYTRIRHHYPERRFVTRFDKQANAVRCFRLEDYTEEELAEERRKREERRRKREERQRQLQELEQSVDEDSDSDDDEDEDAEAEMEL